MSKLLRTLWVPVLAAVWLIHSGAQAQTPPADAASAAIAAKVAAAPWVAGLAPDARPAAAPRTTSFAADPALMRRRLAGISSPWPGNVERIAAQGLWYSPMFVPGMPGYYDVRGLHKRPGS
ncbi:MAG: hypothetical protein KA324_12550 [Rubrivivax sp.]|nr:hypothetical protein [Rubrivivax sp.]MBP6464757.1 hypothetical protein [Rubrivivax sp.]